MRKEFSFLKNFWNNNHDDDSFQNSERKEKENANKCIES